MALILIVNAFLSSLSANAGFCARWTVPTKDGSLPFHTIPEASGMAASRLVSDRIYWINDSGDKGAFYFTRANGSGVTRVKIDDFRPRDTEAMGYGECDGEPCLAIADIGDNREVRKEIVIVFIKERERFPQRVPIYRELTLRYPDGPHNAEAFAILPNGDLLLITKEMRLSQLTVGNAGVYTLPKDAIQDGAVATLKKLGELPIPTWLESDGLPGGLVTDMAINSRRQVLGILTYSRVIEIPLAKLADVANVSSWRKGNDFSLITFKPLIQQESLTYWPNSDRMTWSTEFSPPAAPIFSMACAAEVH